MFLIFNTVVEEKSAARCDLFFFVNLQIIFLVLPLVNFNALIKLKVF